MTSGRLLGSGLIVALLVCGFVIAQPPGPPPRGPGHFGPPGGPPGEFEPDPEMREFMEHVMMARVSKELELDDEQTVLLVRRFVDIKEKSEAAKRKRSKLLREIHDTEPTDAADKEIGAKLEALIALDRELLEMRFTAFEQAGEGLNDWQRARLYVFIQEFDNDMRRLVSRARDRYMERREGGPGMGPEGGEGPRFDRDDRPPRPEHNGPDGRGGPPRGGEFRPGPPPHGGADGPPPPRRGGGPPPRRGEEPPPPPPPAE